MIGVRSMRKGKAPVAAAATEEQAAAVSVATVAPRDIDEQVEVTGTLMPTNEVTVGSRFAGRIAWLIGKEGTRVQKGDLVARLEDQDARSQVRAAQAALKATEARVAQAKAGVAQQTTATSTGIDSAQAAIAAAQARFEQAQAAAAQQATATVSGINSAEANVQAAQARLEQTKTTATSTAATTSAQVRSAEAGLSAAQSQLAILRSGARTQEQAQAKNAVDLARATADNAQANYDRLKKLYDDKAVSRSVLDAAETQMKVSQAQLASAQEQYNLVKEGPRKEQIDAAEAAVQQAQEGVASAKANLTQVDVAKANVEIARTGLAQAQAALDAANAAKQADVMRDKDVLAAQAGVRQAQEGLKAAQSGRDTTRMRQSDLEAALAAQQQASEALTQAMQGWDYTQVFSPVDGVIAEKLVEEGQTVGANVSVFKISTEKSLYFEASISELEATRIRAGQPVEMIVDALQGDHTNFYGSGQAKSILGAVEKVVPVVDARTRSFTVRVVVPASPLLFPGMFARGEVLVLRHRNATAVPKEALVTKGDRQVVYTVERGIAREKEVTVGASDNTYVQLLSGLAPGSAVVTVGQQTLADGDKVRIANGKQ